MVKEHVNVILGISRSGFTEEIGNVGVGILVGRLK